MANLYGVSAYQQTNSTWNNTRTNNTKTDRKNAEKTDVQKTETDSVKTTTFNPADTTGSLVPTTKNGYGTVIGNVELSDKAKDYYNKLKAKFGNMDFILVSKDMKSQVQANAAAYGNASKQVVLIDDEKIEKMATDESFRRKYEGIIAMSQAKLQEAKNSLTSSGASVNNFGMSVDANGKATFFATVEKAAERLWESGVKHVVVKSGKKGCYLRSAQESVWIPACKCEACVDTTGAGDSFVAGFIYALSEGKEFKICASYANQCGARAVEVIGATEWL